MTLNIKKINICLRFALSCIYLFYSKQQIYQILLRCSVFIIKIVFYIYRCRIHTCVTLLALNSSATIRAGLVRLALLHLIAYAAFLVIHKCLTAATLTTAEVGVIGETKGMIKIFTIIWFVTDSGIDRNTHRGDSTPDSSSDIAMSGQ